MRIDCGLPAETVTSRVTGSRSGATTRIVCVPAEISAVCELWEETALPSIEIVAFGALEIEIVMVPVRAVGVVGEDL
jgi:hypothetical protein